MFEAGQFETHESGDLFWLDPSRIRRGYVERGLYADEDQADQSADARLNGAFANRT